MPVDLGDFEAARTDTAEPDLGDFAAARDTASALDAHLGDFAQAKDTSSPTPETDKAVAQADTRMKFPPLGVIPQTPSGPTARSGAQIEMRDLKAADVPIIPKQALPPYWYGKAATAAGFPRVGAALEGISELGSEQTTAPNVLMAPFLPESKVVQRGIGLVFLGQQLMADPQQYKEFLEAKTPEDKIRIATRMVGGHALPALIMAHSVLPERAPAATAHPEGESATVTPPEAQTRPVEATVAPETPITKPLETQPATGGEIDASQIESATAPDGGVRARGELGQLPEGDVQGSDARLRSDQGEGATQPQGEVVEGTAPQEDVAVAQPEGGGAPAEPAAVSGAETPPAAEPPMGGVSAGAFERIYGEGEIPVGQSLSPEDIFAKGQADLAAGKDPYAFADRARKGEVSPEELGLLAAEHDRLVTEAAAKEGTPDYEPAYQRARDFARNMLKPAGTRWHQVGMGLQVEAPIDYSNLTGFRAALEKRFGREMTPEEAPAFQKVAQEVKQANGEAQAAARRTATRVQKHFSKVKDMTFEDAVRQLQEDISKALGPCEL